jgi:putative ABC transport system ATP-binding protein
LRTGDLEVRGVEFGFDGARPVLGPVDFSIAAGSLLALMGPSGSGKSTLLQVIAGIQQPTVGSVDFEGAPFSSLDQDGRARIRLARFGLVFQFAELVPELDLAENVELPLRILGRRVDRDRVASLLSRLGIADVARRLPSQVSGGERQRAAIARAMVHDPAVVLADEPTGALDGENGRAVLSLLLECSQEAGASLVVVTHDQAVAGRLDRVVELRDGRVVA